MTTPSADTIFALSSGRPPAAIAVVRLSGPRAGPALEAMIGRMPKPRHAALAAVRDPETGEAIDQALALWFPGPASETGEDMAELQLHGGRAVVAATLKALERLPGLRHAEAGEFTRRAFENGRLDLTAVEGLADLIGAETEAQRRQALRQLRGVLRGRGEAWRERIVGALALMEAGLDFSDEGDVPAETAAPALRIARELAGEIAEALADAGRGERLREGLTVAIAGPVNAGKSSLFNWLAGRDAAIVSPLPGTTRDVLELHLDLGGYPLTVLDTAGVRASDDPVEQEGVRRAQARAANADLVLWVEEAAAAGPGPGPAAAEVWQVRSKIDLVEPGAERTSDTKFGKKVPARPRESGDPELSAVAVLGPRFRGDERERESIARIPYDSPASVGDSPHHLPGGAGTSNLSSRNEPTFRVSARTSEGMPQLVQALEDHAKTQFGESALVTRARHRAALAEARAALERACVAAPLGDEVVAEELRLAARALGRLLGRVDIEDVLDAIFRDFCIGK